MKKNISRLLVLAIILIVCSSADITFRVMLPAYVQIPKHIKTIAIIDRSVPDDEALNVIEGGLTGEGIGQDKLGTQTTLNGLNDMLQTSVKFTVIRTDFAMLGQNLLSAAFPDPIPWTEIEKICKKFNADAILALEKYDSDFIPTGGNIGAGGKGFSVHGIASVNIGFRLYDLANRSIIDEHLYTHTMNWDAGGGTILDAVGGIMQRNNAIRQVSYDAGFIYGKRISPSWYYITRHYFRRAKGDDNLAIGARMMEANDWDSAIEDLNRALENGRHRKVQGKAAHNLAVVYEILGDLPKAREYAQMAWGRYKIKKSRDYGFILNERIKEQNLLEYQLEE
jgi:tetratricopeptide (TPR) repeat protein